MTIIEGDRGSIVIDPLISMPTPGAALELFPCRHGSKPARLRAQRAASDIVRGLGRDPFGDFLGLRLNGDKAEDRSITVIREFPDTGQRYVLALENCALTYRAQRHAQGADATEARTRHAQSLPARGHAQGTGRDRRQAPVKLAERIWPA
jgi:alkyl sulfatase BDS1-like metallo-beta-lactamase superfamily hydrolase